MKIEKLFYQQLDEKNQKKIKMALRCYCCCCRRRRRRRHRRNSLSLTKRNSPTFRVIVYRRVTSSSSELSKDDKFLSCKKVVQNLQSVTKMFAKITISKSSPAPPPTINVECSEFIENQPWFLHNIITLK